MYTYRFGNSFVYIQITADMICTYYGVVYNFKIMYVYLGLKYIHSLQLFFMKMIWLIHTYVSFFLFKSCDDCCLAGYYLHFVMAL